MPVNLAKDFSSLLCVQRLIHSNLSTLIVVVVLCVDDLLLQDLGLGIVLNRRLCSAFAGIPHLGGEDVDFLRSPVLHRDRLERETERALEILCQSGESRCLLLRIRHKTGVSSYTN